MTTLIGSEKKQTSSCKTPTPVSRRFRTVYQKSVKAPNDRMLKSGKQNKKLGHIVTVKMWQNKPIYSLTLEERMSCPTSCSEWDNCYGNNMPFAHRFDHTHEDFLPMLDAQIDKLMRKHPDGIVLRLHVLGDFYSVPYVEFWRQQLGKHPNLVAYGYTHRSAEGPIGKALRVLDMAFHQRFKIRFSDAPDRRFSAQVYQTAEDVPSDHIICPEQLDKTDGCNTCGLCWSQPKRPIAFLEH